jgi:hypothetical protein
VSVEKWGKAYTLSPEDGSPRCRVTLADARKKRYNSNGRSLRQKVSENRDEQDRMKRCLHEAAEDMQNLPEEKESFSLLFFLYLRRRYRKNGH